MGSLSRLFCRLLLATALVIPSASFAGDIQDPGQVAISVARWLEKEHYTKQKLDDEAFSQKFLEMYLTTLDYNKLYFTQDDVNDLRKKYGATMGEGVLRGDLAPANDIFTLFKKRVEDRMATVKALVNKEYKFDGKDTVEINRQDAPWPKDEADADHIWQTRIESELLREKMADLKLRSPQETVMRRYDQILRNVRDMDNDDVIKTYLTSLAQTYDPHSEYLSPSDLENFQISMKLSLVGVGAVLASEDGYAKIKEIVPGGPADKDGRLKVNDRVAAVAQGNQEFEDVVDMKLDKVVEKIRGKKGSVVRLMVIPSDATDPAKRNVIDIVRDEVKLKDQEAKAEIMDLKDKDGHTTRVGWITLPSFYANMEDRGTPKSTTEDVAALIGRLKQEGIQGLVMDLRRDGGGSLEEAINLTGLFIPRGPVVQAKDSNARISVSQDTDPSVAYSGPLIVVMNRLSASASEIFAAALQDYGRAVIVGDERSFGKGTVQTVLKLGQVMPFFSLGGDSESATDSAGALKLTIQKFYRVKGGSTQFKGVESDIVLPSLTDNSEIGEGSLKNCLPYDEIAPAKITSLTDMNVALSLPELRNRSSARVANDPEFAYTKEDVAKLKDRLAKNTLSLNEQERRQELNDDKQLVKKRDAERQARGPAIDVADFEVTLDDVSKPNLRSVAYNKTDKKAEAATDEADESEKSSVPRPDAIRDETLRIMNDFIGLSGKAKTASIQPDKQAQP